MCIYIYIHINTCIYTYVYTFMYKSRGVTYTGYHITGNSDKGDEGEKRESYLFHHTTRSLCASVAATLSQGPTGGYTCSHRFWSVQCGPKLARFWDGPKRAGKIPLVGLSSCNVT